MKDFIPLGIGIQTSGPDPKKHQLLKLGLVSFLSGARFQIDIRYSDLDVDLNHCKDFLESLKEGAGRDSDLVDEEVDRFLSEQSKVLLEDRPAARIMKMIPMGIHIASIKLFIQKTLPKTASHLWEDSIELTTLFALEGFQENAELAHVQAQYKSRAEAKLSAIEMRDAALLDAYISCYILADFQRETPNWMHG